jgi:hypothetical protein
MTHTSSGLAQRVCGSIEHWFRNRLRECVRCRGCQSEVAPLESICPRCGQANPATVSTSGVVYLALGFAFLAVTLSFLF